MDSQDVHINTWANWDEQLPLGYSPGFPTETGIPSIFAEEELKETGQVPVVQIFYEGPEKCQCCINWVEKRPREIPENERDRYDEAAIRMYKCKDHKSSAATNGGLIALRDHSLIIQSQPLIELIRPSLASIGYFMPEKGNVKYRAPFRELFFAYDKLLKTGWTLDHHSTEKAYLELLTSSLEPAFRSISSNAIRLRSTKTVDFENIWTLFPINTIVYRKVWGADRLYQVLETRTLYDHFERRFEESEHDNKKAKKDESFGREKALQISCQACVFDGTNFGVEKTTITIAKFDGEIPIKDLTIYPATFHNDPNIGRKLAARGRKTLAFQRNVHCEYTGSAWIIGEEYYREEYLNGKVMVDAFGLGKRYPGDTVDCEQLEHLLSRHGDDHSDAQRLNTRNFPTDDRTSEKHPPWLENESNRPPLEHQTLNLQFFQSNPQYLMIMDPFLPGFSFKYNRWYFLEISKVSPITWTRNPLDLLVLKQSIKDVVAAFAKNHFENLQLMERTRAPKGQGLVLLLTGPPGTGKTMIAEATAEEAKLPLYRIHSGELGSQPSSVEKRLRDIMELATEWRAIVLLDEADAFIRIRERTDRTSGEIVSIFLRQLEHFKGMLCLTSNIPHEIDPALKSRCRLNIQFENLTSESRREIWRLNLETRGIINGVPGTETKLNVKVSMSTEDWDRLVTWKLNGREIHNVVKNAILWSLCSSIEINLATLEEFITFTVPDVKKDPGTSDESTYSVVSPVNLSKEQHSYTVEGKRSHAEFRTGEHEGEQREKRPRVRIS